MRLAIHQPEYLPCLALVAKAARVDRLVLLDDCQFNRDSLQQRARICDAAGAYRWLTIPFVHNFPQPINEVAAAGSTWGARHLALVRESYAQTPGFAEILADMEPIWEDPVSRLADNVAASMEVIFAAFGVEAPDGCTSSLGVDGAKGDRVLAICKRLGASTYVCGKGGASYLDGEAFAHAGVQIEVSAFDPAPYRVGLPTDAHAKGLSAIDAWAWIGGGPGLGAWLRSELQRAKEAA